MYGFSFFSYFLFLIQGVRVSTSAEKLLKNRPFWKMLLKMLKNHVFLGAEILSAENCYEFVILGISRLKEYENTPVSVVTSI